MNKNEFEILVEKLSKECDLELVFLLGWNFNEERGWCEDNDNIEKLLKFFVIFFIVIFNVYF